MNQIRSFGPANYHLFLVDEWAGEVRNLGEEHQQIKWFSFDEVSHLDLAAEVYVELFSKVRRMN